MNEELKREGATPSQRPRSPRVPVDFAVVREQSAERAAQFARALNVSPIVAGLLIARGYDTVESARRFLNPSHDQLHDPLLMLGMKDAVARILRAIDAGEKILIYGDYDV